MVRAAVLGLLLLAAGDASLAADVRALFTTCVACHGARGEGDVALGAPALAAQDAAYLERQLRNFRGGIRGSHAADTGGAQMRAIAGTLTDDAANSRLAAFIAALPRTVNTAAARGDLHNGNNLYQGKCGACHGTSAQGNAALKAPRLTGLDSAYFKRQFAHFRDGVRGTDPADLPGRQMALMARTLASERELDDVIAYIQQRGRSK